MKKISVQDYKFQCPLLGKELKVNDKKYNFGICGKCKYNLLGQIIDNKVYCNYGSSSGGGSGSESGGQGEQTYGTINDLPDVDINNPKDGQTLVYDEDTNTWQNSTLPDANGNNEPDELWNDYDPQNP